VYGHCAGRGGTRLRDFGTLALIAALVVALVIALGIAAFGEWRDRHR
jgi:hypothetical protein